VEYLIGSTSTIVASLIILLIVKRVNASKPRVGRVFHSQSNIYERIKPAIPYMPPKEKESQARNHRKSQMVRIAVIENNAYWISNNNVFMAPVTEEGMVDYSSGTPIDTMAMDKVELNRISYIVERLTEGSDDDSSNTGNQGL
jgi:hypothetical protein